MTHDITITVLDKGFAMSADGRRSGYTTLDDLLIGVRAALSPEPTVTVDSLWVDDGWREWDGELRPGQEYPPGVKADTPVVVRFRDGSTDEGDAKSASYYRWYYGGGYNSDVDVVNYRVVRP